MMVKFEAMEDRNDKQYHLHYTRLGDSHHSSKRHDESYHDARGEYGVERQFLGPR